MVINTEWGSFDNTLKILPKTKYDEIVDSETANKGFHLFEKELVECLWEKFYVFV